MTLEEAKKVAKILIKADGGCHVCVKELFSSIQKEFPEFIWDYESLGRGSKDYIIDIKEERDGKKVKEDGKADHRS